MRVGLPESKVYSFLLACWLSFTRFRTSGGYRRLFQPAHVLQVPLHAREARGQRRAERESERAHDPRSRARLSASTTAQAYLRA